MQTHEPRQRLRRLLPLDVRIVLARLEQTVVGAIGRVVEKDIEDEAFLDGLAHRVAMERLAVTAEDRKRLVLRRRGEGEEAQVCLATSLGHASGKVP